LLQTLNEMQMQPQEQHTARLIVTSLLSHCRDLLGSQIQTAIFLLMLPPLFWLQTDFSPFVVNTYLTDF
jgi:hypothetical protein